MHCIGIFERIERIPLGDSQIFQGGPKAEQSKVNVFIFIYHVPTTYNLQLTILYDFTIY
jgi:hypothetical protein